MRNVRGVTPVELLAATTAMAMLVGFGALSLGEMKPKQKREKCAANLRGLGQAHYIYAQDDPQFFPAISGIRKENDGLMTLFDAKNRANKPTATGTPSPTVDLWALMQTGYAAPKTFICPSTKDVPDPAKDVSAYFDFASSKNLSYAYQYQHDPDRRIIGPSSEPNFPVMADANPYIKGGVTENVLTDRLSKFKGNSTNHSAKKRVGQNILFVDGHVTFEKSPDVGLSGKAQEKTSRFRDNCFSVFEAKKDALVDPGLVAPTATKCNLGGRSDSCLVP